MWKSIASFCTGKQLWSKWQSQNCSGLQGEEGAVHLFNMLTSYLVVFQQLNIPKFIYYLWFSCNSFCIVKICFLFSMIFNCFDRIHFFFSFLHHLGQAYPSIQIRYVLCNFHNTGTARQLLQFIILKKNIIQCKKRARKKISQCQLTI